MAHSRYAKDRFSAEAGYAKRHACVESCLQTYPATRDKVTAANVQGRYSYVGAQPSIEVIAKGTDVRIEDRERGTTAHETSEDPISIPADMSAAWQIADDDSLPKVFTGGWVGYSGYDTVRYVYSGEQQWCKT